MIKNVPHLNRQIISKTMPEKVAIKNILIVAIFIITRSENETDAMIRFEVETA